MTKTKAKWRLRSALVTLRYYTGGLYDRLGRHHLFLLASGMAFSLLVCILPLVLILFAIAGQLLQQPAVTQEVERFIERLVPYPEASSFLKDFVGGRIAEFSAYKRVAGILGSVGLIFAASGLFSSMRTILNVVYRPKKDESILKGKLRDIGFVALVLAYFLIVSIVAPGTDIITGLADNVQSLSHFQLGPIQAALVEIASFGLILFGFFIIYFAIPHERPPKTSLLVSAFWATLLWHLAAVVFRYYLAHMVTFKRVWGPYALVVAVAFWSYYTSIVFIVAAEVGQLFRERREQLPPNSVRHDGPSHFFRD